MKGIEQARKFYTEVGIKMIADEFGDYQNRIAVGLVGHGSECFGFDDEVSRDHDFEVGFCMWLTKEDEEKIGFKLMRAYDKLKEEYCLKNGFGKPRQSAGGASAQGVYRIDDFYRRYTGCDARRKRCKTGSIRARFSLLRRRTVKSFATTWASLQKFATRFCMVCPRTSEQKKSARARSKRHSRDSIITLVA